MAWWLPLAITGGSWLANKLFGSKPQAPDINAPQYSLDTDAWLKQGRSAIEQQTTDWLNQAMRGYRGQASGRGWTPGTTSGYTEFGDRASEVAARNMSTALADLEGQAARLRAQGMGMYGQDYRQWLASTQQGQSDWIASLMGMLGSTDWSKI